MPEVRVCSTKDVPVNEARRFDLDRRRPIAVVHLEDGWYAVGDTCTHQKISLSEGEVHPGSHEIECWKHGSCFSLIDGSPNTLPATKPVPVYEIRLEGDDVMVVI
jgi:3-phenylpropionate/trans-cinnamate dioxygenase ferredoxin component